jgi:hypothetical protein
VKNPLYETDSDQRNVMRLTTALKTIQRLRIYLFVYFFKHKIICFIPTCYSNDYEQFSFENIINKIRSWPVQTMSTHRGAIK